MPWTDTNVVEQRLQFVMEWKKSEATMSALCRAFGISRQTGYKWLRRYFEDGDDGGRFMLQDRSCKPLVHPQTTDSRIVDRIIRARKLRPQYGPRKLRIWLRTLGNWKLPAPSTIGAILTRHGLTRHRRLRRRTPPYTQPFAHCTMPNSIWCVDFKGHFRTKDGTRLYPLTIMDAHSRFLLRCEALLKPDGNGGCPVRC